MNIRKILVPLDGSERDRLALMAAFSTARVFEAHVEAMHVRIQPADSLPFVGEGMSAALVQELVELTERESAARAAVARETFEAARAAASMPITNDPNDRPSAGGPTAAWLEVPGQEDDLIVRAGRLSDLIVLSRPAAGSSVGGPGAFNTALFETGRPLLVPGAQAIPLRTDRIVVAWDGSAQAARALAAAMPFLDRAEEVTVVTCEEGGDDEGGLADVTTYLSWHGITAGRRAVPPHPGVAEALVAAAIGTDLLVMGGYSHSRLREIFLGGVTRYMLEKAALPLLLMH